MLLLTPKYDRPLDQINRVAKGNRSLDGHFGGIGHLIMLRWFGPSDLAP